MTSALADGRAIVVRWCGHCGQSFIAWWPHTNRRWCSPQCVAAVRRARTRARAATPEGRAWRRMWKAANPDKVRAPEYARRRARRRDDPLAHERELAYERSRRFTPAYLAKRQRERQRNAERTLMAKAVRAAVRELTPRPEKPHPTHCRNGHLLPPYVPGHGRSCGHCGGAARHAMAQANNAARLTCAHGHPWSRAYQNSHGVWVCRGCRATAKRMQKLRRRAQRQEAA